MLNAPSSLPPKRGGGKVSMSYIDKGIESFAGVLKDGYTQWETASNKGFFYGLDTAFKSCFLAFFSCHNQP